MTSQCPLCIIPARGGSKRLPGKNMAVVEGKTLLEWTAASAVDSGVFSEIFVSSEDDSILAHASELAGVTPMTRPAELATDTATIRDVCRHILEERKAASTPCFSVLLTGNPLRTGAMIHEAWQRFEASDADALMSLVPFTHPPQRAVTASGGRVDFYFTEDPMRRAQEFESLFRHDGSVYFARTKAFLEHGVQYLPNTMPYIIAPEDSVDIDTPLDLEWAEFRMSRRKVL